MKNKIEKKSEKRGLINFIIYMNSEFAFDCVYHRRWCYDFKFNFMYIHAFK